MLNSLYFAKETLNVKDGYISPGPLWCNRRSWKYSAAHFSKNWGHFRGVAAGGAGGAIAPPTFWLNMGLAIGSCFLAPDCEYTSYLSIWFFSVLRMHQRVPQIQKFSQGTMTIAWHVFGLWLKCTVYHSRHGNCCNFTMIYWLDHSRMIRVL